MHNAQIDFVFSFLSFFIFSDKQNRELRDGIVHSVAQLITGQITDCLTTIMMNDLPRHILPVILNQLDKMKAQLLADVGQKLKNCDQVIKESIMNMASSKVCVSGLGEKFISTKFLSKLSTLLFRHRWRHSEMPWL